MAIIVRGLETREAGGYFDCVARVAIDGRDREMVLRRYGDHPDLTRRDDTFDPFAVALLVPAMIRGEPLVIEGGVDEFLLVALRSLVQETLRLMAPAWKRVAVEAEPRPAPLATDWSKGAATAMSGGIDSMHLMRHRFLDPGVPEAMRVRTPVHHHVGAHGDDDRVFDEQVAHARRVADRLGLPLVGTRCSFTEAYRGMKHIHSVLPRNVAASLALDHLFAVFHYGSSEPLGGRPRMTRFDGIATLEPQLLPLFNTTKAVWMQFGADVSRLQKTADVLAEEWLRGDLLVCIRGFQPDRANLNCGRCYKCCRVLLHAEADGILDQVAGTFDLEGARRGRTHALVRLVHRSLGPWRNGNETDLLKYLHERRFPFPAWIRPAVALAIAVHGTRHSLRPEGDGDQRPAQSAATRSSAATSASR
ncbi:MAG: hypothetical protein ACKO40_13335 [Planctomycetaceae bacterium]